MVAVLQKGNARGFFYENLFNVSVCKSTSNEQNLDSKFLCENGSYWYGARPMKIQRRSEKNRIACCSRCLDSPRDEALHKDERGETLNEHRSPCPDVSDYPRNRSGMKNEAMHLALFTIQSSCSRPRVEIMCAFY